MPIRDGLVLEYHFDEESGTNVYDSSSNGLDANLQSFVANGTPVSAPTRGDGKMGGPAIHFDGTSMLNVGHDPALDISSFTIMAWIWYTWNGYPDAGERRQEVAEKADTYWMNVRRDTKFLRVGYMNCAGDLKRLDSTIPITETTDLSNPIWTHVAATFASQTLRIYINGIQDVNTTLTDLPCTNLHPLIIGGRFTPLNTIRGSGDPLGPDAFFKGAIDEFRLFSRALSGSEIRSLLSDVYIRDNLNDQGIEPLVGGGISMSPDINHYSTELLDPQTTLGSPAAQTQGDLFQVIEIGQSNYIYVRLQNRGIMPADDIRVDIYWTPVSTLPTPNVWSHIGEINAGSIAPGEFKVAGPVEWPDLEIPDRGHYCFVAVLGNEAEPKPDLSTIVSIDDFYRVIRSKNNVTWKNFNVRNQNTGSRTSIDFEIRGWQKRAYKCDLIIDLSALPRICDAELRILRRLTKGALTDGLATAEVSQLYTRFVATTGTAVALRNIPLKASDHTKSTLTITLPDHTPDGVYDISIAQRINNREMGRVTTRLIVGDFPFVANRSSGEVHKSNCEWVAKMSPKNKVAYTDVQQAIHHSYNGCHYCLPNLDTG